MFSLAEWLGVDGAGESAGPGSVESGGEEPPAWGLRLPFPIARLRGRRDTEPPAAEQSSGGFHLDAWLAAGLADPPAYLDPTSVGRAGRPRTLRGVDGVSPVALAAIGIVVTGLVVAAVGLGLPGLAADGGTTAPDGAMGPPGGVTATPTPTAEPDDTPTASRTPTPTSSSTPTPSPTATPTPTPRPTATLTPFAPYSGRTDTPDEPIGVGLDDILGDITGSLSALAVR